MTDLLNQTNLHALKSIGHHLEARARENGGDTGTPLAFVGLVTMAIGATMFVKGMNPDRGR